MRNIFSIAVDKGRIVEKQLGLKTAMFNGEIYNLICSNDIGFITAEINRLHFIIDTLLYQAEKNRES